MRPLRFLAVLATAWLLSACGPIGSSQGANTTTSGFASFSLQATDLPSGFARCNGLSGRYPGVSSAYLNSYADGAAWRSIQTLEAQDAWVDIYASGAGSCNSYRTASDPIAKTGPVIQLLVIKYRTAASATTAFTGGHFIPAEPAGFMDPKATLLYGSASRGTDTNLGPNSYVDSGAVGSYSFVHAAFQKGQDVVSLFGEKVQFSLVAPTLLRLSGRVPVTVQATPAPISCTGLTNDGTASISGNQLMFPSSGIPPLHVYAIRTDVPGSYCMTPTVANQRSYAITGLPVGTYVVIAYRADGKHGAGGYTQAVPCGLQASCDDHSLIPINLRDGQAATGINPNDWYTTNLPPEPHS